MKYRLNAILALTFLMFFTGCISYVPGGFLSAGSSPPGGSVSSITGLSNNAVRNLDAAVYEGLTISYNKVTLAGKGQGKTIIRGRVVIEGNSCTIKDLTIRGDVIITGNNADLRAAGIEGEIKSKGNNNIW